NLGTAYPLDRREPTRGGHARHRRLSPAIHQPDARRDDGRDGGGVLDAGGGWAVRAGDDHRARLYRAGGDDLRKLAAIRRAERLAAVWLRHGVAEPASTVW